MNIKVQMCGIVITLVLWMFFGQSKKLSLPTTKAFRVTFLGCLVTLILDINSLICIEYRDRMPLFLVHAGCKIYLLSLAFETYCAFAYLRSGIYLIENRHRGRIAAFQCTVVLLCLAILVSPIAIYQDENNVYTYGLSTVFTYVVCVGILIANFVLMHQYKNQLPQRRCRAICTWLVIWIVSAVIQFFNPELLMVSFAASLGIMVIYLHVENPELMLDTDTNLFNYGAFLQYARYLYTVKKPFSLVSVIVSKQFEHDMQMVDHVAVMHKLADMFEEDKKVNAFFIADDEIYFVVPDKLEMERVTGQIERFFAERDASQSKLYLRVKFLFAEDGRIAENETMLSQILHYARMMQIDVEREQKVHVNKEYADEIIRRQRMEQQLLEMIEEDRIEVFFQPIYSTQEHRFTSAEALMRLRDSDGKMISPYAFICVAEANGIIIQLGKIIFEKVCRFLAESKPWKYGLEYVEVNLSIVQGANESLAEDYIEIMRRYCIEPKYINLEITETGSVSEKQTLLRNMEKLMEYGVTFSLDDFGTGQSNLNYIVEMPVRLVKFDRDMTNAYFENRKARFVMDAAMQMIRGMNLGIVSEGVETKEQYQEMENLGIQYIQGYYFSRPLPPERFLEFLQKEGNHAKKS